MKYKLDSKIITVVIISAMVAAGAMVALWILSLFSWFMVYIALFTLAVPVIKWLMDIWIATKCYTLEELWYELTMGDEEDKSHLQTLED